MKPKLMVILLAGLAVGILAGCSGGGGGGESDVSRIKGRYRELQKGLENKDIQRVMSVYSRNYFDGGVTYNDVATDIAKLFIDYNDITEDQSFSDITVSGNYAYVTWTETFHAYDVQLQARTTWSLRWNDILHWENGNWFIYGDQKNASPVAPRLSHYNAKRLRDAAAQQK
jgi:hypothetical protein